MDVLKRFKNISYNSGKNINVKEGDIIFQLDVNNYTVYIFIGCLLGNSSFSVNDYVHSYGIEDNFLKKSLKHHARSYLRNARADALLYPIGKISETEYVDIEYWKKLALKSLDTFSFNNCMKKSSILGCYTISSISRFTKFKDLLFKLKLLYSPKFVIHNDIMDKVKETIEKQYNTFDRKFETFLGQYTVNEFKKDAFCYSVDENNVITLYLYLGKKQNVSYWSRLSRLEQFEFVIHYENSDLGFDRPDALNMLYDNEYMLYKLLCRKDAIVKKTDDIKPTNRILDVNTLSYDKLIDLLKQFE